MFGTIGSGGLLLIVIVALILHRRGAGRLKVVREDHHVFYWGAAAGLLAAGAGAALSQVATVGATFSTAVSSQSATVGAIGPAGVAALLVLIAFGTKPAFGKDLVLGVAAPAVLSAAGGIWLLPVTILGSLIHAVA